MTDPELQQRFTVLEQKMDSILKSTERTRKYLRWRLIISILLIVLPLVGLSFAIPKFISTLGIYKDLIAK